jgi:acyl carrier protein
MTNKIEVELLKILKKYNKDKLDLKKMSLLSGKIFDSFDIIKFVLEIEVKFKVSMPLHELYKIKKLNITKLSSLILKKIKS